MITYTKISSMSPEECDLELTMYEVKKLFQKARKAQETAQALEKAVYQAMEDMCIDIDAIIDEQKSINLKFAIHKYLQSESFSLRNILKEVRSWYTLNDGN